MTVLSLLKPGDSARLLSFGNTEPGYRQRLLAMGITRGTIIHIKRFAPLGCPVQVEVRGTSLSLRLQEARELVWEQLACS